MPVTIICATLFADYYICVYVLCVSVQSVCRFPRMCFIDCYWLYELFGKYVWAYHLFLYVCLMFCKLAYNCAIETHPEHNLAGLQTWAKTVNACTSV
jgi:hypothetical protein